MQQFEILPGLPATGPMHVSITSNGESFFSEGYVVRFFLEDGSYWVANFQFGLTSFNAVYDFPEHKRVLVIAGGEAYLMAPSRTQASYTFGGSLEGAFLTANGSLVLHSSTDIVLLERPTGIRWRGERISWDGFRDLALDGDVLRGESWSPLHGVKNEWTAFELDLRTRILKGGSYPDARRLNPGMADFLAVTPTVSSLWDL